MCIRDRIRIADLFAGIGGIRMRMVQALGDAAHVVYSSEWNKYSVQTLSLIHIYRRQPRLQAESHQEGRTAALRTPEPGMARTDPGNVVGPRRRRQGKQGNHHHANKE